MTMVGARALWPMVMAGESCSEGRGFESEQCIVDGHFFTLIVVKFY